MKRETFTRSGRGEGGRRLLKLLPFNDQTWFPFRLDARWTVNYRVGYAADGKIVVKELSIKPVYGSLADVTGPVPDGGISKEMLRQIPVRSDLRYIRAVLRTQQADPPEPLAGRGSVGRPRKDRTAILARYRELCRIGKTSPETLLADEFGYSQGGVRALISRSRRRGELA